jgi:hypothetical protein
MTMWSSLSPREVVARGGLCCDGRVPARSFQQCCVPATWRLTWKRTGFPQRAAYRPDPYRIQPVSDSGRPARPGVYPPTAAEAAQGTTYEGYERTIDAHTRTCAPRSSRIPGTRNTSKPYSASATALLEGRHEALIPFPITPKPNLGLCAPV